MREDFIPKKHQMSSSKPSTAKPSQPASASKKTTRKTTPKPTHAASKPAPKRSAKPAAPAVASVSEVSFKPAPVKPTLVATPAQPTALTFQHITDYPLINETLDFLIHFPLLSYVAGYFSLVINLGLLAIGYFPTTTYIYNTIDYYLYSLFVTVDSRYPEAASFSYSDAADYLEGSTAYVKSELDGYKQKNIDPIVKKGNDLYETTLNTVLPNGLSVEEEASLVDADLHFAADDVHDEIQRSVALAQDTLNRLEPLLKPYVDKASAIPGYVAAVYNEELSKSGSAKDAIKVTTSRLSSDAFEHLKPVLEGLVTKIAQEEAILEKETEEAAERIDAAKNSEVDVDIVVNAAITTRS